ncbi:glycosyltransferase [Clostridium sp.]|uniref:glycosyltransferase n=1 Tax=Clostridium sp. TaxID=1506 RepID=UPI003F3ECEF5
MKSIMIFITGLKVGGAESQVYRICKELDRNKVQITVVSLTSGGAIGEKLKECSVDLVYLNLKDHKLRGLRKAYRLVNEEKPDVVVGFLFHAIILSRIVGYLNKTPRIISSIRSINTGGFIKETLLRLTDFMTYKTVVNSEASYKKVLKKKIVREKSLMAINNIIDTNEFSFNEKNRLKWRIEFGINDETFLWMAVGRLVPEKDYITMIKAFKNYLQSNSNSKLLIIGDGEMKEELEVLIKRKKLEDNVRLLGRRSDVSQVLSASDGVILTSKWEGIPNTIIEAMCMDRIVVATDVGGVSEVVRDNETGFLVEKGKIESIVLGMKKASSVNRVNSREIINKEYDSKVVIKKWEKIFSEERRV